MRELNSIIYFKVVKNTLVFLILFILSINLVSASGLKQQRLAIQKIFEQDNRLGKIRNHASEDAPMADAVNQYVKALRSLDWDNVPKGFQKAFYSHIAAWEESVSYFNKYPQLRGEMHDVFKQIRNIDSDLKTYEKQIWSTWAQVEIVSKFYKSNNAERPILFSSNRNRNTGIFKYISIDGSMRLLTEKSSSNNWPIFVKRENKIIFQSRRNGKFDLYSMDMDSLDETRLTDFAGHDYLPSVKKEDSWIYFLRREPVNDSKDSTEFPFIYRIDPSSKSIETWSKESPNTSTPLSWRMDGELAIASIAEGKNTNLFSFNTAGKRLEKLTHMEGYVGGAAFSNEGSKVAFYWQNSNKSKIGILDLNSNQIRWIVDTGYNWHPKWSSDDRWIMFSRSADPQHKDIDVYTVNVEKPIVMIPLIDSAFRDSEASWIN